MLTPVRTTLPLRARGGATALTLFNARIAAIVPMPAHTNPPQQSLSVEAAVDEVWISSNKAPATTVEYQ